MQVALIECSKVYHQRSNPADQLLRRKTHQRQKLKNCDELKKRDKWWPSYPSPVECYWHGSWLTENSRPDDDPLITGLPWWSFRLGSTIWECGSLNWYPVSRTKSTVISSSERCCLRIKRWISITKAALINRHGLSSPGGTHHCPRDRHRVISII